MIAILFFRSSDEWNRNKSDDLRWILCQFLKISKVYRSITQKNDGRIRFSSALWVLNDWLNLFKRKILVHPRYSEMEYLNECWSLVSEGLVHYLESPTDNLTNISEDSIYWWTKLISVELFLLSIWSCFSQIYKSTCRGYKERLFDDLKQLIHDYVQELKIKLDDYVLNECFCLETKRNGCSNFSWRKFTTRDQRVTWPIIYSNSVIISNVIENQSNAWFQYLWEKFWKDLIELIQLDLF